MTQNLVRPIDFGARYGEGLDRSLVLSGGGVFVIAWQTAYLATMADAGIDLRQADRIVGTSAGSMTGAVLCSRRISWLAAAADVLAKAKPIVSYLAPVGALSPSQQRAMTMFMEATDADPEVVRAIGHAAMAAKTPSARTMRRNVALLVETGRWPSRRLWVTAVDAYTGERVVVTKESRVNARTAVAASCALPGLYAPQSIHDHRCMDGGLMGTGTHCDLVAGAKRAVVLSMAPGDKPLRKAMFCSTVDAMPLEMAALRGSGTKVFHRWAPMREDMDLMSPDTMEEGLEAGRRQAAQDADELREFWA